MKIFGRELSFKSKMASGRPITPEEVRSVYGNETPQEWFDNPEFFDMKPKPKSSGYGYVQSPYASWFTRVWGTIAIPDYANYRNMYRTVPIIKSAIDMTVNLASGKGFEFSGSTKKVREYLDKWFEDINTTETMQIIMHDMLTYGNAFLEICYEDTEELKVEDKETKNILTIYKGKGKVIWLKPIDPYYMRVRRDAFGNILGYIQWITYPPIAFDTDKIAHFKWSPKSWSYENAYGVSMLMSMLKIQDYIWQLEQDFQIILHTHAKPSKVFTGGTPERPFSETQMTALESALAKDTPAANYFVRGDVKVDVIETKAKLVGLIDFFNYLRDQRLASLGVPPVLLGMPEGSNRSNSQVAVAEYLTRVQMLQETTSEMFEDVILPMILKPVFGDKVEIPKIQWNAIIDKGMIEDSQRIVEEFKVGIRSKNEARIALELEPTENPEDNIPQPLVFKQEVLPSSGGNTPPNKEPKSPDMQMDKQKPTLAQIENEEEVRKRKVTDVGGIAVFVVDSEKVAKIYDYRWGLKDNPVIGNQPLGEFSSYIPNTPPEIWISDIVPPDDIKYVIIHEYVEYKERLEGHSIEEAHKIALEQEGLIRKLR